MPSSQVNMEKLANKAKRAVDLLVDEWSKATYVPSNSQVWGKAAIRHLANRLRTQPAMVKASLFGADIGAESLSPRPFQGITEVIQNADDLGATSVRVAVRAARGGRDLLIVHDGLPLRLEDIAAMVLPWLTTKSDDPRMSGRFGIGQKTLLALGGPIEVHCRPFHFRVDRGSPVWIKPEPAITNFYSPKKPETLLRLPLNPDVDADELNDFVREFGAGALIFMKSVRSLSLVDLATGEPSTTHRLSDGTKEKVSLNIGDQEVCSERLELYDVDSGTSVIRYIAELPVPGGQSRRNKKTGDTTPLGIAFASVGTIDEHRIFDRVPTPLDSPFPFHLNGEFDPDAARSTILKNRWNRFLFTQLSLMASSVILDSFAREISSGWNVIPLTEEIQSRADSGISHWSEEFCSVVQQNLRDRLTFQLHNGEVPLDELVFEHEHLDGLLTPEDLEELNRGCSAIPPTMRDGEGRWRQVLRELDTAEEVGIELAITVLDWDDEDLGERRPDWFVGMARAALDADEVLFNNQFLFKRCVLLEDSSRIEPPGSSDPIILTRSVDPQSLAATLGVAKSIHPIYVADEPDSRRVLSALKAYGIFRDDCEEPKVVLSILARDFDDNTLGRVRLQDQQLLLLRDAFERLDPKDRQRFGSAIGRNVELRVFRFDPAGQRQETWKSPAEAYLPSSIDRETESFARAAHQTAGINWLDRSYSKLLTRRKNSNQLGAQAFLVRLGAATAPRIIKPDDERQFWQRDARWARRIDRSAVPSMQRSELLTTSYGHQYLLNDHESPDLDAVVTDIAADKDSRRRKKRGLALLKVLTRAWEREYAALAKADAVSAYNGYWQNPSPVTATWLANAASTSWLPSRTGRLQAPRDLCLPTEANRIAFEGRRAKFLAPVDEQIKNSSALKALGFQEGPSVTDLLSRLKAIRDEEAKSPDPSDLKTIYTLLGLAYATRKAGRRVDGITVDKLRSEFAVAPGLIFVSGQWFRSDQVFQGRRIFGQYRPFVPSGNVVDSLWTTLEISEPDFSSCVAVLRDVASTPLIDTDEGVVIDCLRAVAGFLQEVSPQQRSALGRLPLWTANGWQVERPIYLFEDNSLATQASRSVPVWNSGFESFDGLEQLLGTLKVTVVKPQDLRLNSINAASAVAGSSHREQFSSSVRHLRDVFARGDRNLFDSLAISWENLETAEVYIDDEMALFADLGRGKHLELQANAHFNLSPPLIVVRSPDDLALAEGAGRAVASLFDGDRQKVAWAWASMWSKASSGVSASRIVIAHEDESDEDSTERLTRLKGQAAKRGSTNRGKRSNGAPKRFGSTTRIKIRELKEISQLAPDDGTIVNHGKSLDGVVFPSNRKRNPSSDNPRLKKPSGRPALRNRSVLPPQNEREQLAFDAVREALRMDPSEIADLRARKGMGADALDELRQYYEIKMESGGEFPDTVSLTKAEAELAQADDDFFLAVVCGLESNRGDLRVRFIFKPLETLRYVISGNVTLAGVRDVEALEYRFRESSPSVTP